MLANFKNIYLALYCAVIMLKHFNLIDLKLMTMMYSSMKNNNFNHVYRSMGPEKESLYFFYVIATFIIHSISMILIGHHKNNYTH